MGPEMDQNGDQDGTRMGPEWDQASSIIATELVKDNSRIDPDWSRITPEHLQHGPPE